jgi:hypothetical protein
MAFFFGIIELEIFLISFIYHKNELFSIYPDEHNFRYMPRKIIDRYNYATIF